MLSQNNHNQMKKRIYNFCLNSNFGGATPATSSTFFIDYGYAEKQPTSMNFVVSSLLEASEIILRMSHEKN